MDTSREARLVLSIIHQIADKHTAARLDAIRANPLWAQPDRENQVLLETLNQLQNGGLVSGGEDGYTLTKKGHGLVKIFLRQGFSTLLVAIEQSPTARKFCQRVYGRDLCQLNSMSMLQLEELLEVLDIGKEDHVLDLGCGAGLVSEYISDLTGARVTGVDFAAGAIEHARQRAQPKASRLDYKVMDMDELDLPENQFSALVSIDALHFARDLRRTIYRAKASLREKGRMGIFYAAQIFAGEHVENLQPERTPLAQALRECGLRFKTWDFTEDESEIWEKILAVSEELQEQYETEGRRFLYEMAIADAEPTLEALKTGWRRKYLYHAW